MLINFNPAYLGECAELYHAMFVSPEWGYKWLTIENTHRYFSDMSAAPRFVGYMYLIGNRAVGCCFGEISDYFSSVQYTIKEIFIKRELQGRGHGSGFLADIEAVLKKNKVDNIILSTSRSVKAFGFYLKNGYIESTETVFLVKFLNE